MVDFASDNGKRVSLDAMQGSVWTLCRENFGLNETIFMYSSTVFLKSSINSESNEQRRLPFPLSHA
jgi:hypothetical protein